MAEEYKSPEINILSPKSLYEISVTTIAKDFNFYKSYLSYITNDIFFDIYYELYKQKQLCLLGTELSNLETFVKTLNIRSKRVDLLQLFQALIDHDTKIANQLVANYEAWCLGIKKPIGTRLNVIKVGLNLGGFLSDGGWYPESEKVLIACRDLCLSKNEKPKDWCLLLECCHKLLNTQAYYCSFKNALETYELTLNTIEKLESSGYQINNYAAILSTFSLLFIMRSEYDKAFDWSIKALAELKSTPSRVVVDVLRQAAKACVLKREFDRAGLLIRQAIYLAREIYGINHPKYSDVLIDYGFYLLNYDSIINSVSIYKTALLIREKIFGKSNLHVAIIYEDLAYALYVNEYATGRFNDARDHAEKAIIIMEKLLPPQHLLLASAKRVKALILEEIALDVDQNNPSISNKDLLQQSEDLHLSALKLAQSAFGQRNVQTAKHYGNLGRLYQSMRRFTEAEKMHLKAITIKEDILGPDDYEVGLSVGHLASLYNFHMDRLQDAEKLYYRSIAINLKLFGNIYSGLEYDYRGLIYIYEKLHQYDKLSEFRDKFKMWKDLRKKFVQSEVEPIDPHTSPEPIENVIRKFFSI